jgi:hypothetical protein
MAMGFTEHKVLHKFLVFFFLFPFFSLSSHHTNRLDIIGKKEKIK